MTRTRICLLLLLLTPLAVYWPTIFHEFGLGDDYSLLREAHEQPGKVVKYFSSHGRPLYGALIETSFSVVRSVEALPWLRLVSVGLLSILGVAIWRQLYQSGWTEAEAMVIGLGVTLLPAAQVVASWASTWPHLLALLLALAGFSAVEAELERGGLKRIVGIIGGIAIYALAALIYQSNALFAIVPIASVLLVRPGREPYNDRRWCLIHLATLIAGLLTAFCLVQFLFNSGVFMESSRMAIESSPLSKFLWYFWQPLPNALALFALRDDFNTGAVLFWSTVVIVMALLAYSYKVDTRRSALPPVPVESEIGVNYQVKKGHAVPLSKTKWLVCLLVLPILAHLVSLVAAERSTGYRTLFALSSLVLVLLVYVVRSLRAAGCIHRVVYYGGMGLLLLIAVVTARQNSLGLIAAPQGREWDMVRSVVMRADFRKPLKAYIITPQLSDRSTVRVHGDEFGSVSSDSDRTPREMFIAAVHERFPEKLPKGGSFTVVLGRSEPPATSYDIVIDLRKLKSSREP